MLFEFCHTGMKISRCVYAGDELILLCYLFNIYNSYAHENIINCDVLQHDNVNNSDHLGVMYELRVECPDAPVDGLSLSGITSVRLSTLVCSFMHSECTGSCE